MPGYRKLSRPSDQRRAILRNQVTNLIWNGKIVTTKARAKEVSSIAEKLITLAVNEYNNVEKVKKKSQNEKNQYIDIEVTNDLPSRLAARRRIISFVYNVPEPKKNKESKGDYNERTKDVNHPVVEKIFNELAPKYDKRRQEMGTGGGYTRIVNMGPRRGDGTEMVLLELI